MNILFVCTGNTCRSPMAEAILKYKYPQFNVQSAGIFAANDEQANPNTIKVLQKRKINIDHHSQPVSDPLLAWADYVFVMTKAHEQLLNAQYPKYKEKYYPFKQFVNQLENEKKDESSLQTADHKEDIQIKKNDKNFENLTKLADADIFDPFGGSVETYEQTYRELEGLIDRFVKIIR